MGELRTVPISMIRENKVALRTVDRKSEQYLGLIESIRIRGWFGAITVRQAKDKESGEDYLELIDGLHRFSAAKDAGIEKIGVDVMDLDESQVLEAQILANAHKVETKPAEYSRQLLRILNCNPLMTESELASKLGKSTAWINSRLSLTKIKDPKIASLINEDKIPLSNAYALAKLPPEEMADFVDRAMTLPPDRFLPEVNKRAKEIRDARRKGKDAVEAVFSPVAYLQKLSAVKDAMENAEVAKTLVKVTGVKTPVEGFILGIQWVLHLDPESSKAQIAANEDSKKKKEEAKQQRKIERAKKMSEKKAEIAEEAAKAAAELKA